ncbi:MAG: hypothetical protein HY565_02855 [Candidatus Kerfeldbacteria bacterium]|nr:hypothetical protein [Candidatus Kerfeldbacteria bacterium]
MALSFLFIGLTKTTAVMPEVVQFFPAALAADYMFVLVFVLLSRHSLPISLIGGLVGWAMYAAIALRYPPTSFALGTLVYFLPVVIVSYWWIKHLPQVAQLMPVVMTWQRIAIRALLGGSVLATVVILTHTLGNIWGSLFSAFPAAWSSTFVIYYLVHGKTIIPAVGKSLFLPGAFTFMIYAYVALLTFPTLGIWLGTAVCYLAVMIVYSIMHLYHLKR